MISDLPKEIILIICKDSSLIITSAVCKSWRKLLLTDRIDTVRAMLPIMKLSDILNLPAVFYEDLSINQKILLPNVLFRDLDIAASIDQYAGYKYKIAWSDIFDILYVNDLHKMSRLVLHPCADMYFGYQFRNSIQYRYYICEITNINLKQYIFIHIPPGDRLSLIQLKLETIVWAYVKNDPNVIKMINDEYAYIKHKITELLK